MIQSICPNCGNKKMFSDDKSGKKYKCPNCSEVVTIESIGTAIVNEHQANVTDTYAASIEQAEENNRIAALNAQYQKLLSKSKVWNGWGTVFYILAAVAVIMVLSKDYSQIISIAFWGGLGAWFKKKSKEFKEQADELYNTHFGNTTQVANNAPTQQDQQNIDEYYNQHEIVNEVQQNSHGTSTNNVKASIERNAEMIEGVYVTNNASLVQSLQFVGDVSASSGWSGLAEDIGIKNAQKSLVKKVRTLNGNVVLITESSTDWGVKIKGKAYVC